MAFVHLCAIVMAMVRLKALDLCRDVFFNEMCVCLFGLFFLNLFTKGLEAQVQESSKDLYWF